MKSFPSAAGRFPPQLSLLAVLAMVGIGGAGWYFAKRHEAAARSTAAAALTSIADLKADLLESWMKERRGDAAVARSSAEVLEFLAHPDDPTRHAAVEEYFRSLKQAYDYDVIAVFDSHGALLLATSTNRLQQHSCVSNHVASALTARDVVVTDLHREGQNEPIHLSFLSPIQLTPQTNGPADGLVLLMVDAAQFLYPFVQSWPVPSPTSETLLVRREGNEALYLSEARHRQGMALNLRVPLTRTEVPAVRAVLGERGLMAGVDNHGVPVLAVAQAIEGTSWLLMAQVDQAEINAPIKRDIRKTGIALALAALTVVLGIGLSWRQQRLRFMQEELVERQRAEAALRESEERYRLVSENSSDVIWLYDLAAQRFTYVSPSIERLRGFTVAEVQRQQMSEIMTPASFRRVEEMLPARLAAFAGGDDSVRVQTHEIEQTCRDGSVVPTEVVSTLIAGADHRATHIQGVSRAIAERKAAEEALRRSEQKFASVFRFSPDPIFLASLPERRFVALNEAVARISGYTPEELVGRTTDEIGFWFNAEDKERYLGMLRESGRVVDFETEFQIRSGARRRCLISTEVIQLEGKPHILSVVRDITERKQTEEQLRLQETRLRLALEAAEMVTWELDVPTGRLAYSTNLPDMTRTGDISPYLSLEDFAQQLHPDDRIRAEQAITQTIQAGTPFDCEYRVRLPDGSWHWLAGKGRAVTGADGRVARVLGVSQDITERKQLELARASEHALNQAMIEAIPGAFYMLDAEGRYVRWNAYLRDEIVGKPDDQVAGFSALETIHPEDRATIESRLANVLEKGREETVEGRVLLRGGPALRWLLLTGRRAVLEGRPYLVGFGVDITERKQAEAALQHSEAHYRLLAENTEDFISVHDTREERTYTCPSYYRVTGWTPEEVADSAWDARLHPDDLPKIKESRAANFAGRSTTIEHRIRCRDGSWIWVESHSKPIASPEGEATRLLICARNITERKQAEAALRAERERLASIIFGANVGTWEWNVQTGQTVINERWAEMLGYTLAELAPVSIETWRRLAHPDDLKISNALAERHFRGDLDHYECEMRMRHKSGNWVWVADRGRVTSWTEDGKPLLMRGTHADITERKRAEDRSQCLRDVGFAAAAATHLPEALELCLQAALRVSGMESAGLYLLDSQTGALDLNCHAGLSASFFSSVNHLPADSPQVIWARNGRPFHGTLDALGLPAESAERREGLKAIALLPVLHEGHLVAVLNVASHSLDEVPPSARHALETIAGLLAGLFGRLRAQEALHQLNLELEQRVNDRSRELAASEQHLRTIYETSRDAIVTTDAQGRCLDGNPAALAIFGFPDRQSLFAASLVDVFPERQPDGRRSVEVVAEYMAQTLAQRTSAFECVYRRPDGSTFPAEVSVAVGERDGQPVFHSIVRDVSERKEAEARLRQSEQRFRAVWQTSRDAILTVDAQGRCLDGNPAAVAMFGFPDPQSLVAAHLVDLTPEHQPDGRLSVEVLAEIMARVARRGGGAFDWVHQRRDGTAFPAEVSIAIAEQNGQPVFHGIVRDVSRRKQAEARLHQSEQRVQAIFRTSRDAILTMDARGRWIDCNPAAVTMFGFPNQQTLLTTSMEGLSPEYQPDGRRSGEVIAELMQRIVARGGAAFDWVLQRRDGTAFPTEVSVAVAEQDGQPVFHGIVRDVSERKEAEARLRESEQRHRVLVETIPDWVWEVDAQGCYVFCGPQCRELLGYEPSEIVGQKPFDLMPPEEAQRVAQLAGPLMRRGEVLRALESAMRRKDGRLVTLERHGAPVFDADGRVRGYRGVDHDITERKQVSEELRQAKERAEAANRAKSVFLANMSHEIRTPMNAVLGFTQLLLRETGLNSEQRQRLATIMRSGEHLMDIINGILEMARIESGQSTLNPAPFDLAPLLQDVESMFRLRADAQKITFTIERADGLPRYLVADATKLRQVFINLLSNAFKFTPAGGHVALRLHATPESAGQVRLKAEVEDTGIGLKPEDAACVFDPFFQTDSGRAAGGTGLGLSISREFARLMGGDLTVKSQVGSGSCFEFQACLPVAPEDELPERRPRPAVLRLNCASAGYPILVADDLPENRNLLTCILARLGFTVRTATNGLEAVEQCQTWSSGLVILDLRMPVMDGFEAARRLRAAHGAALRILVLTASVADEVRQQSLAAGADAFLGKPVRAAELLECIQQLTGVEYDHGETETGLTGTPGRARGELPSADAVRQLPVELLHALRKAFAAADYEEMLVLVAKVSTLDELLGGQLRELVESFNYAALDTLLKPN